MLYFVSPTDPGLYDRTSSWTVATTDPRTHQVLLSDQLEGPFLCRVLTHELGHVIMISYNLLGAIHRMVYPEYWVEMEEWLCNFLADYNLEVAWIAEDFLSRL